jgi:IS5 family transposase
MKIPDRPFAPIPVLWLEPIQSDLLRFLEEAHAAALANPELLDLVDKDLDAHGLAKKALRIADKCWVQARQLHLGSLLGQPVPIDPGTLRLGPGRPRTPAYLVYMALLLRGFCGEGYKARGAERLRHESITLAVLCANMYLRMPKPSTLTELVNAVSVETRERILDAQLALVLGLGLDDFLRFLQDSTHVESNSAWPTESGLLVALLERLLRLGARLPKLGLPELVLPEARKLFLKMRELDRELDLAGEGREAKHKRPKRYRKLLRLARKAVGLLQPALAQVLDAFKASDLRPSIKARAQRVMDRLQDDLAAFQKVIETCTARVLEQREVPAKDKVLSVSDPDASMILKGQRKPVLGYRPQLARSGSGFITGLFLPRGNAADAPQLEPMVRTVIARTGVVPEVASVDDGYASQKGFIALKKTLGIRVVSINGAKGKALLDKLELDWNDEKLAEARDLRSAIESLMFTLKQGFDFGEAARRGLRQVLAELLEKALAYNLCHLVRVKARLAERDAEPEDLDAAA